MKTLREHHERNVSGRPRTSELNRIWQTLQDMMGRLVLTSGTPKVWLITAFWTGSIWSTEKGEKEVRSCS